MPDITFSSRDAVPEELRAHIKEVEGKIVVNLVPKATLDTFRDNNIQALRDKDEAIARAKALEDVAGSDPAKLKAELAELRATSQLVKDGKLTTSEAVTKEADARIKAIQEELQSQLRTTAAAKEAEKNRGDTLQAELNRSKIDQGIMDAILAPSSGANPSAAADIRERAYRVFTVGPTGALIPKSGETVIYGADGAAPMSPKEWLAKLLVEAPHFSKLSQGGGAGGDPKSSAAYGGMSEEAFLKLPAEQRMTIYRNAQKKAG